MFFVFCAAVASIAWIISGFTMSHNRGLAIWIGFVGIVFFEAICVRVYQVVTTENRSEQAQQSSATAVEEQQPPIKPDEKIEALTTSHKPRARLRNWKRTLDLYHQRPTTTRVHGRNRILRLAKFMLELIANPLVATECELGNHI